MGQKSKFCLISELPPRTRRIPAPATILPRTCGTTSAHAENTNQGTNLATHQGNYLRARGEYGLNILFH